MIGKTEGRRSRRQEDEVVGWHHPMDMSLSRLWEMMRGRGA